MLVRELQTLLARLYDAPTGHDVAHYLITDAQQAASLQGHTAPPPTDEQLLLAEADDGVELSLYVDAAVWQRLQRQCPLRELDARNLADFCTALEGVSHFHYVVWNADRSRSVSLLDLELQGEVDKYAGALQLILEQRDGVFPRELFGQLFDAAGFLPQLTAIERRRYEEAHRYAARFCRRLEERFMSARRARPDALLRELRRFYRLGRHAKLRHAQQWS